MRKSKKKIDTVTDLAKSVEEDGVRWIQTSADDLLSTRELNSIVNALEKDTGPEDIVLARIDFQKVNKEYYEAVVDLQATLKKQNTTLKQLLLNAKETIDKKNKKLKELITYIKKLHLFIAYNNKISPEDIEKALLKTPEITAVPKIEEKEMKEIAEEEKIEYSEVEEILLDEDGKETESIQV